MYIFFYQPQDERFVGTVNFRNLTGQPAKELLAKLKSHGVPTVHHCDLRVAMQKAQELFPKTTK